MPRPVRFIALGSVWLDEIHHEGQDPIRDVVGGSLTYATLGARLFLAHDPSSIGMFLNAGNDFPDAIIDEFRSWNLSLEVRRHASQPSARGIVTYARANRNRKGFQRLTSPLPVTFSDLANSSYANPAAVEIFCSADEILHPGFPNLAVSCSSSLSSPQSHHHQQTEEALSPFIIWEPHVKTCLPSTRDAHIQACERVDVFSPNHEELASFFAADSVCDNDAERFDPAVVGAQAALFVQPGRCVVVRCAEHGCVVLEQGKEAVWLSAFFGKGEEGQGKIVDATGAGNAFLGAFAVGWLETRDHVVAAEWGTVAASFVMEQVGLPQRVEVNGVETWNGDMVCRRLEEYRAASYR